VNKKKRNGSSSPHHSKNQWDRGIFPERKRKMKCLQSTGPKFWLWRGKLSLSTNKDNGRVETIKSDETGMGRQTSKEKKITATDKVEGIWFNAKVPQKIASLNKNQKPSLNCG
jgi:hypothetical protein